MLWSNETVSSSSTLSFDSLKLYLSHRTGLCSFASERRRRRSRKNGRAFCSHWWWGVPARFESPHFSDVLFSRPPSSSNHLKCCFFEIGFFGLDAVAAVEYLQSLTVR